MGVLDKFLDVMRLNDDDYDEFEDDDDFGFDDDDEPAGKRNKTSSRREKKAAKAERSTKAPIDDFTEHQQRQTSSKITPISKNRRQGQASGMEVCVIKPSAIEDEIEIADTLLGGRTVVINMEGLAVDIAQRIIDFTSGAAYALHGNLQKISNYIFLATPQGVDISGDIQSLMDSFDIPDFKV
ncbi:MAG: cell division protein SepF [Clostridiales bacterium]|nr:cell division protein SepF [Clostridiales bacterium]